MSTHILRFILALTIAFGYTGLASAQYPPGDPKLGTKLGVMDMNNSGEAGEVTLFGKDGGHRTLVVVSLQGAPHRPQPASIHRADGCDRISPVAPIALGALRNGHSETLVNVPIMRLLSGNYSVMVGSQLSNPTRYVACGHLYL
jgi:hypothetical protein